MRSEKSESENKCSVVVISRVNGMIGSNGGNDTDNDTGYEGKQTVHRGVPLCQNLKRNRVKTKRRSDHTQKFLGKWLV